MNKKIIFIYGMPGNGKSYLGKELNNSILNSCYYNTDALFYNPNKKFKKHLDNFELYGAKGVCVYSLLNSEYVKPYMNELYDEIIKTIEEYKEYEIIILEGYCLKFFLNKLKEDYKNSLFIEMKMRVPYIMNTKIQNDNNKIENIIRFLEGYHND